MLKTILLSVVCTMALISSAIAQERSPDQVKRKTISDAATLKVLKKLNKRIKKLEKEAKNKKTGSDKASLYKFSGRVYVDTASYSGDRTVLKNGTRVTSARMGIGGKVVGDFSFKIKIDVKKNDSSVKQAYIKYKNDYFTVLVGHHNRPTGLENWMSSKYTPFSSGAYANNAFDHGARIGASISTGNDFFTAMGGIYASSLGNSGEDDDPLCFAGRMTAVPFKNQEFLWHVGMHTVYEEKKDEVGFSSGFETNVEGTNAVDTNTFVPTDFSMTTGFETGLTFHSFYLASEYYMAKLDKRFDATQLFESYNFSGFYVSAGFFLTGENRSYGGGAFGAFELVARLSSIDLNDIGHDDAKRIYGGEAQSTSIGLNWSPEDNVRVLLSYTGHKITHLDNSSKDESPSVIQARFQIGF